MPALLRGRPAIPAITGSLVALLGLGLAALGGRLQVLGGTPYYFAAGVGLLASGVLIALARRTGVWLYLMVLGGTVVRAIAEVGLDGWALIPRVVAPAVLGLWLCAPPVWARVERYAGVRPEYARRQSWAGMAACAALIALVFALVFAVGDRVTEARFLQLSAPTRWKAPEPPTGITPANVAALEKGVVVLHRRPAVRGRGRDGPRVRLP
ncbi:membrane hypothetical protein [uncultured Alphaproteobacteria bacterium]|uniref:Uncharacterized protein n=1 Tax=uncultured Alphaproteobacteria bacterium TaxID=91750 RepID=A0A212KCE0_9PROT|nr:membrane hypothetical protein [uncultured Alphaproteobacteria bacterium]